MTAKMKQLVVVAVVGLVLLLALLGEVSARRHKRSTKRLMNWEQQRLEVDKKYFATVMSDYEDLNSKMKTLLNSALEKRENIIKEAIVLASIKPPTEARETLFRAHRMAYAAITPEMQTILDKYYEFGYNEDLLGPIDRRMLRRINNYFYKTVPENKQKYSYGYDYSLVYYPLDDLTDEDEKELNDESYYSNYDGLYYDDPREYSDPDADHELYTRNDLVEWEKQQIDYDYQYVRWSITQTSPGSFAKNVMAHQVYSAVELREKIITDALASISADKSLEEGKAILFGAHKRAFDESQSYLQKALENLNKRPPYDNSEYPKKHLENIERRFRRGLEEYRA